MRRPATKPRSHEAPPRKALCTLVSSCPGGGFSIRYYHQTIAGCRSSLDVGESLAMRTNHQIVSRACLTLIAFLLISASIACRKSASVQRYELKGKVVSVDKRGSTVTIAHQAISGYMEAMTMTFMLDDE